ncbi:MAG: succinyl-diaminopimelate desuccinylase [Sandaracinaceae bacterium]|nr:succinyl-diaminopimelate desuccinylase [Sandaracinaceae bacterium]
MSELASALAQTLLDLTRIHSPTGEEKLIADFIEARLTRTLGPASVSRHGRNVVARIRRGTGAPRIAFAGHTDTVRTAHDGPPRIEGDRLFGAGASDMKSGLAVMIELGERLVRETAPVDLTLVFYASEEGPFAENALGPLLVELPELHEQELAICLEPSDNKLQLGCMGSVHATVAFTGRTSHSARPWQGENAIVKAASFLTDVGARAPRDVDLDGHLYREVIVPTTANGGRGRNIVPDRFELNVNFRFAPGRTPEQAVDELRAFVADRAEVDAHDLSPAGRPYANHPLVRRLIAAGVQSVETKQAWTDVARFDQIGVPAVNFGPGTQAQAHQRNEYTELPQLAVGFEVLRRFLSQP